MARAIFVIIKEAYMRNGAYAEICGELKEDIVIKGSEDGQICGLIYVLTNPVAKPKNESQSDYLKPNYIPVLLMGVDIIKKHGASLKKGEKVWLVGKFETAQNNYAAFSGVGFGDISGVIISLHDKNRLRVITNDRALSTASGSANQIAEASEFSSISQSWATNFH
jgi:uncharacterized protein YuzE